MSVLLALTVLVGGLVILAILKRINWFGLLDWKEKDFVMGKANGGLHYSANAKIKRADYTLSVINDGYGDADAPYEYWLQSRPQLERKGEMGENFDDYEDVTGWQTEDEVAEVVRRVY